LHRRLNMVLAIAGLVLALAPANAADYPSRRITLVAPWPPAGTIERLPSALDIPPLVEAGVPGFDAAGWGTVVAPAHTPAPIVTKLYDAFRAVGSRAEVRDRLIFLGLVPQTSPPPSTLQAFVNDEMLRWGKVVRAAGIAGTE
jgi:tripartite-type tricarboxylate transporter receptor subunit TctC